MKRTAKVAYLGMMEGSERGGEAVLKYELVSCALFDSMISFVMVKKARDVITRDGWDC